MSRDFRVDLQMVGDFQDHVTVCGFANGCRLFAYLPDSRCPPSIYRENHAAKQPTLSAHAAHISQNHKARVPRRRLPAIDEAVNGAGTRERDGKSQVG